MPIGERVSRRQDPNDRQRVNALEVLSVAFVLSAGMLGYEILLARIASVLLTSDHLFVVLSLALLGLAAGAIIEYFLAAGAAPGSPEPSSGTPVAAVVGPGWWLAWNGLVLILATLALVGLGPRGGLGVLVPAAALPFVVAGLILSRLFRVFAEMTAVLYGADLLGAAAGALLVPPTLGGLGPVQAVFLYAAVQAGVGAAFVTTRKNVSRALPAVGVAVVAAFLFTLNRHDELLGPIPVGQSTDKDMFRLSASAPGSTETVDSRWSTFGRTDLVRFGGERDVMSIFIDGAAGTPMFRFDGDLSAESATIRRVNRGVAGVFVLASLHYDQKDTALVIGPGGGRDVLLALQAGFRRITAVDVNPQMVQIVKDYEDFNGGLYTRFPNVEVVTDEGRRFLRASRERYDLITLFMPVTKSSRGLNVFALSENYLFTREAMGDYHRHLTDEGVLLIMAHAMEEAVKLVTTAVEVLREEGMSVSEAMDHVYVLGSHMMPYVLLARRPLEDDQRERLHALAHAPMFDSQYSYVPGIQQQWITPPASASPRGDVPMMNPLLYELARGALPLARVERGLGLNLMPATDDRPFFSQFGPGPPGTVLAMLWASLAALLGVVIVPGRRLGRPLPAPARPARLWLPLWFTGIGVGFIVIELVLFQKLAFHLGDPSRSLALLLASLLAGSGAGSLLSIRARSRAAVGAAIAGGACAVAITALLPSVFATLQAAPPARKLAVAGALLVAQGVPLGMMFPIGLRVAGRELGPAAVPWMWAINGAASVAGSALAVVVAITAGYTWSLALGVACYGLAAVAAWQATRWAPPLQQVVGS